MKLYLHRIHTRGVTTDGALWEEHDIRICDTAEHAPT